MFFVPLSTMLRHAIPRPQPTPWDEWGPDGTRVIADDAPLWTCHTAGMKCVVARIPSRKGSTPSLRLYDFASGSLDGQESVLDAAASVAPTVIPASPHMFDVDVETRLPVRCYDKNLATFDKGKIKAAMMAEDAIILVHVRPLQLGLIYTTSDSLFAE